MSSAGTDGDGTLPGGNAAPLQYYCHQCQRTVSMTPSPSSDIFCPLCNGSFLEEYEISNPTPNPHPDPFPTFADPFSSFPGGLPLLFRSYAPDLQDPRNFSRLLTHPQPQNLPSDGAHQQDPGAFNPLLFLQDYVQSMRAGGANIQFVFENNPSDPGFRLPANLGDYFIGPGLEQLIQQLAENDPTRYGTPPASKAAIEKLPDLAVTDELLASDSAQCAVCMNDFERGMKVKQMPCKHIFHSDCLLPWLELHNSCPVCRYELPTDDPDHENQVQGLMGSQGSNLLSGGGGGSLENLQTPRSPGSRVIVSFPWPPNAVVSPAETSEGSNVHGNNEAGSNSAGQQGWDSGSETRQEDLD